MSRDANLSKLKLELYFLTIEASMSAVLVLDQVAKKKRPFNGLFSVTKCAWGGPKAVTLYEEIVPILPSDYVADEESLDAPEDAASSGASQVTPRSGRWKPHIAHVRANQVVFPGSFSRIKGAHLIGAEFTNSEKRKSPKGSQKMPKLDDEEIDPKLLPGYDIIAPVLRILYELDGEAKLTWNLLDILDNHPANFVAIAADAHLGFDLLGVLDIKFLRVGQKGVFRTSALGGMAYPCDEVQVEVASVGGSPIVANLKGQLSGSQVQFTSENAFLVNMYVHAGTAGLFQACLQTKLKINEKTRQNRSGAIDLPIVPVKKNEVEDEE